MRNLVAAILFPGALLAGCDDKAGDTGDTTGGDSRVTTILALEGDSAAGGDIYTSNCASCHLADGSGDFGPSLIEEVPEYSDEEILDQVINGEGSMPAFGDLSDQQLADLLAYLRATFG